MNILIYRTSSIGDVILTTALLSAITKKLPESRIIFVSRQPQIDLLRTSYPLVEFIEAPKEIGFFVLWSKLKSFSKIDLIIDLQVNLRSIILLSFLNWLRSSTLVRMKKNSAFRNDLIQTAKRNKNRTKMEIEKQFDRNKFQFRFMLEALQQGFRKINVDVRDLHDFSPCLSLENFNLNLSFKLPEKFLAICVGAAHDTKKMPLELLATSLSKWSKYLADKQSLPPIVLLGSKEDFESGQRLTDLLKWRSECLNLAGKISFSEVSAVLSKAKLLVSNDSALAHVAEAVGTPVAVFFGPTVEQFGFAPWREQSRAFSSSIGCRPCSKHGKKVCHYGDKRCFVEIDFEDFLKFCMLKFQD